MKTKEAAADLDTIEAAKQEISSTYRAPILLIAFAAVSYGLMVFGWGMTEHENLWALGMWGGFVGLVISMGLFYYTFRILGIKLKIIPRTKGAFRFNLVQTAIFAGLIIGGREIRLVGFDYAPHIAAFAATVWFGYLLYRHPTGEYL